MEKLNPYEVFANRMEEKYPKMFAGPYGGFAVGQGWWPIIESLLPGQVSPVNWDNGSGYIITRWRC